LFSIKQNIPLTALVVESPSASSRGSVKKQGCWEGQLRVPERRTLH